MLTATAQSDLVNVADKGKPDTAKDSTAGPPKKSFFEKVSQELSKAFTLDRTSTRVASALSRHGDDSKPNIRLSKSQGRTTR